MIARFVPIVRTLAPITAGAARMSYPVFAIYNILGAIVWGVGLTLLGYGLGQFEIIQKLLEPIFILIALASIAPMIYEWYKRRRAAKKATGEPATEAVGAGRYRSASAANSSLSPVATVPAGRGRSTATPPPSTRPAAGSRAERRVG